MHGNMIKNNQNQNKIDAFTSREVRNAISFYPLISAGVFESQNLVHHYKRSDSKGLINVAQFIESVEDQAKDIRNFGGRQV